MLYYIILYCNMLYYVTLVYSDDDPSRSQKWGRSWDLLIQSSAPILERDPHKFSSRRFNFRETATDSSLSSHLHARLSDLSRLCTILTISKA